MDLIVHPGRKLHGEVPAQGEIALPGDKSLSHRTALLAALAEGESRIAHFLVAGVTRVMLEALRSLGIAWDLAGDTLTVQGVGWQTPPSLRGEQGAPAPVLECGSSATTMRLLAGTLAAWGGGAILDGSPGLRRRPMGRIIAPLQQMGVHIEAEHGCAPLRLFPTPRPLRGGQLILPVASAQVKSCLLLAGLAADQPVIIQEPGPSRDHTERLLRALGLQVQSTVEELSEGGRAWLTRLEPPAGRSLAPLQLELPGDFSSAAFLIVAALITPGSEIVLRNVGLNPTRTGLLEALQAMGGQIEVRGREERFGEARGDLMVRYSTLQGGLVRGEQVVRMIDEFPVFAVAAAAAQGVTRVMDAAELRTKESDRIHALVQELQKLGIAIEEQADGFLVRGGRPWQGGSVEAHGDHRLAMALAVAGLAAQQAIQIRGAEIIHESFPNFCPVFEALGAEMQQHNGEAGQ